MTLNVYDNVSSNLKQSDAIINHQQLYDINQLKNRLTENGLFITQQVGGLNNGELHLWLNIEPVSFSNWSLRKATKELQEAGFEIEVAIDDINLMRFYDIKALFYYLRSLNSEIPTFSVKKDYHQLEKMNHIIQGKGYLDLTRHRFLIISKKMTEIEK